MYNFKNDYTFGAHPKILDKLAATNLAPQAGYGKDDYTKAAIQKLQEKMARKDAAIFLLSGGTQTNLICISFLLRVHEAVICASSGHIAANETGAIEATGHKVIITSSEAGKLRPSDIAVVLTKYDFKPHVVKPRLVYISNSTEIGTFYTKKELRSLYLFCQKNDLLLYLDGARLGHALMAEGSDLSLNDISQLTDVFYIGATKNGGLLGEALVFPKAALAKDFTYVLKQKGALLAKGRLLAIQFLVLFTDDLYFKLAKHANEMAFYISEVIETCGYTFLNTSTTNQIFPVLPKPLIQRLQQKYSFYVWKQIDEEHSAVRLITSWATDKKIVDALIADIKKF